MGKAKKQDNTQEHELTEIEFNYLQILSTCLTYNTARAKIISGFLYYVCNQRLGYPLTVNLQFEIDPADETRILKVTEITGN